ncbi:MAG: DUF4149 domain-containing protein [Betaproteobacteria bacterium]|nr:DUF4149 domain-containing protein [Betaproteobacteria bacterium]
MKSLPDLLAAWAVALWGGGLWAVGYLAAPTLFYNLEDRALAGMLAGKMFSYIGWVGLVCGVWLLVFRLGRLGGAAFKQGFFWIVLVMLLLTAAQQFGIQPLMQELKDQAGAQDVMDSLFKDRFAAWHGISSAVYLIESLLGLTLVAKSR